MAFDNETVIDEKEKLRQSLRVSNLEHTFANFKVLEGTEQACNAFKAFALGKGKPFLLCYGGVGNGKTHLLKASAISLRERDIFSRYYTWTDIMRSFKSHLGGDSIPRYDELLQRFCHSRVLLIDDVGMGNSGSDWEWGQLEEIINFRYRQQLMTALVTNKDLNELPDRVISRFRDPDVGVIVLNKGADYRRRLVGEIEAE